MKLMKKTKQFLVYLFSIFWYIETCWIVNVCNNFIVIAVSAKVASFTNILVYFTFSYKICFLAFDSVAHSRETKSNWVHNSEMDWI